uniref:Putative secreted peptide n=1 Tax=Anopheles braziliensis TaxID=58242 RepID=A0A2M3ZPX8_9DIPT
MHRHCLWRRRTSHVGNAALFLGVFRYALARELQQEDRPWCPCPDYFMPFFVWLHLRLTRFLPTARFSF